MSLPNDIYPKQGGKRMGYSKWVTEVYDIHEPALLLSVKKPSYRNRIYSPRTIPIFRSAPSPPGCSVGRLKIGRLAAYLSGIYEAPEYKTDFLWGLMFLIHL